MLDKDVMYERILLSWNDWQLNFMINLESICRTKSGGIIRITDDILILIEGSSEEC